MDADEHGLKHEDITNKIIGIFYDVYNELGAGFLESVYESSLAIALQSAGLSVQSQVLIPVWFRQRQVGEFRADLITTVLLEVKAARAVDPAHEAPTAQLSEGDRNRNRITLEFRAQTSVQAICLHQQPKTNPRTSVLIRGSLSSAKFQVSPW